MTPIVYIFAFLVLITLFDFFKTPIILKKITFGIICVILSLFAGFRYGDRDFLNYVKFFQEVNIIFEFNGNEIPYVEKGYLFLNSIIKTLGFDYRVLFVFVSFISCILFFIFVKDFKYRFSALLIYFSHTFLLRDMMQIRAGIAANILLFSVKYIEKDNFIKFILIVIIAGLFHSGAFIFLFLWPIYKILKNNIKNLKYIVFVGYILGIILSRNILTFIFQKIGIQGILNYMTENNPYFETLGLMNPVLLKNTIVFIFLYKNIERFESKLKYTRIYLTAMALSIFWLATFNNFSIFAARIASFLSYFEILLIPMFYMIYRQYKFFILFTIILFCFVLFYPKIEIFRYVQFNFFY
jgi:hypothetical protein